MTFVAAVAQASTRLAHATESGHAADAIGPFLMVFFAIWWAWMNFTWFASAYDSDDGAYRLAAFVQMAGVILLAAGVGEAFEHGDYTMVTLGYLVMRLGLLSLWVRAAVQHPASRGTSGRYAAGVAALEVLWLGRLAVDHELATASFLLLVGLELLVPVWAERRGSTSWHPHHIAERYALFTILLLGEGVFAATSAVVAVVEDSAGAALVALSLAGLAVVGAIWWLYFELPAGTGLEVRRRWSFVWGYGHYALFAAIAATAAGLEVVVAAGAGHVPDLGEGAVLAALVAPVAVALVVLDLLRIPPSGARVGVRTGTALALFALAALVAGAELLGTTTGACLVAAVLAVLVAGRHHREELR